HEVLACTHDTLDIGDRDRCLQVIGTFGPDAVVHAGAWTDVDGCESDPDRAWRANALGTRHVAEAARLVGTRVCYVSTDYVFDGRACSTSPTRAPPPGTSSQPTSRPRPGSTPDWSSPFPPSSSSRPDPPPARPTRFSTTPPSACRASPSSTTTTSLWSGWSRSSSPPKPPAGRRISTLD